MEQGEQVPVKTDAAPTKLSGAARWWTYQRERFPVFAHGPLIAAFSFSAVCYSSLLRGTRALPDAASAAVAFTCALLFFLELRIADEYKDFDDDARYRPYRPVPRGLVTLRELGIVFFDALGVQSLAASALTPRLLVPFLLVLSYLGLMTKEFFVGAWLRRRPVPYLLSHMLVMPLIDFFATACDWLPRSLLAPRGLQWFLIVSFFNGIVIEIGRKIRAAESEEPGVETYTALWGVRNACLCWLCAIVLTLAAAMPAARQTHTLLPEAITLGVLALGAMMVVLRFLSCPVPARAKFFELYSGAWTLTLYLSLGVVPRLTQLG